MSRRGAAPRCETCGSLERHRAGRLLTETIRDRTRFKDYAMLRFDDDGVVARGWFRSCETHVLGTPGAMDPHATGRPDGAFGMIVCYHVLTRLPDHRKALLELTRILSPSGLMLLAYPSPATRDATTDWDAADPERHGSYRILGRDFEATMPACVSGAHVLAIKVVDPVTRDDDLVYVVTKDFFWARRILAADLLVRLLA